jgi:hypothetical protein
MSQTDLSLLAARGVRVEGKIEVEIKVGDNVCIEAQHSAALRLRTVLYRG